MRIKYLGHASFLITSQDNKKILTDPYAVGNGINYQPINESADVVTSSHNHGDHNNVKTAKGSPVILSQAVSQTINGIDIKAVPAFHDETEGSKRGKDIVFCFKVDGITLCHLGDLGHQLSTRQIAEISPVDVLFIPVGGYYTIDAEQAALVAQSLKPRLVFPMHYKTIKAEYPIAGVDIFLKGKRNVRQLKSSEIEISKSTLPEEMEIVVLQPAN
jgi:L-ascorbate metabolism protein UlaG (beta-lactamase superfamily)